MTEPIRILQVMGTLNRGGTETMLMNIYRNIDRSKVQFDFIIHTNEKCDYNDEIVKLGGKIFNIVNYNGKNHFLYKNAWNTFFSAHPEYKIIHAHKRSTASIYLKVAKKYGMVTIAHSHSTASRGTKIEQISKNIIQFPIRYVADYLFACSNEAGKWLFGKNVIKKDNYKVIKNAIDIEKYTFNLTKRNEMRKALGVEGKFVVGHVGTFTYPKNHKLLIDIFYEIQKQKQNSVLLLVGDGELRQRIEKQINDLRIKDKVILTGVVENVNEYIQAMDVFVFPSIFEGLGMAAIEAQAAGIRCIVSDKLPNEVFITDLVESVSLNLDKKYWGEIILKYNNDYIKENMFNELKLNGYDVKSVANNLKDFYIKIYNSR